MKVIKTYYFAHQVIERIGDALLAQNIVQVFLATECPKIFYRVLKSYLIAQPLILMARILRYRRRGVILVREFNTKQLYLMLPILFPFWKNVYWINNHNLHFALMRKSDRFILSLAIRMGFNLVLVESRAGVEQLVGKARADQLPLVRYPVLDQPKSAKADGKRLCVGFVGRFRHDKDQEGAIAQLLKARAAGVLDIDVLVATPDATDLQRFADQGCLTINTTSDEGYAEAMDATDIAVLNYHRHAYEYRPSGVLRDLLGRHIPVALPDFPVLADQLMQPVAAGATYSSLEKLPEAIIAIRDSKTIRHNFKAYCEARSDTAIGALFRSSLPSAAH